MSIKQNKRPDVDKYIADLKAQMAYHVDAIEKIALTIKMWQKHPPEPQRAMKTNSPLTRDLIRNLAKGYGQPLQTVQIVDLLYKGQTDEERSKLIKTLSVMLNQMEKEGEITIEKKPGVKGNFYKWKK